MVILENWAEEEVKDATFLRTLKDWMAKAFVRLSVVHSSRWHWPSQEWYGHGMLHLPESSNKAIAKYVLYLLLFDCLKSTCALPVCFVF